MGVCFCLHYFMWWYFTASLVTMTEGCCPRPSPNVRIDIPCPSQPSEDASQLGDPRSSAHRSRSFYFPLKKGQETWHYNNEGVWSRIDPTISHQSDAPIRSAEGGLSNAEHHVHGDGPPLDAVAQLATNSYAPVRRYHISMALDGRDTDESSVAGLGAGRSNRQVTAAGATNRAPPLSPVLEDAAPPEIKHSLVDGTIFDALRCKCNADISIFSSPVDSSSLQVASREGLDTFLGLLEYQQLTEAVSFVKEVVLYTPEDVGKFPVKVLAQKYVPTQLDGADGLGVLIIQDQQRLNNLYLTTNERQLLFAVTLAKIKHYDIFYECYVTLIPPQVELKTITLVGCDGGQLSHLSEAYNVERVYTARSGVKRGAIFALQPHDPGRSVVQRKCCMFDVTAAPHKRWSAKLVRGATDTFIDPKTHLFHGYEAPSLSDEVARPTVMLTFDERTMSIVSGLYDAGDKSTDIRRILFSDYVPRSKRASFFERVFQFDLYVCALLQRPSDWPLTVPDLTSCGSDAHLSPVMFQTQYRSLFAESGKVPVRVNGYNIGFAILAKPSLAKMRLCCSFNLKVPFLAHYLLYTMDRFSPNLTAPVQRIRLDNRDREWTTSAGSQKLSHSV